MNLLNVEKEHVTYVPQEIELAYSRDILNQARQVEDNDADAVRRARELLLSGRLTSPENVRATAENIVAFGI